MAANPEKSSPAPDDLRGCCEWETGGQRCWYPGTTSHSILGGGPWFCRFHVRCTNERDGAQIVYESREQSNRVAYWPKPKRAAEPVRRMHMVVQDEPGASG